MGERLTDLVLRLVPYTLIALGGTVAGCLVAAYYGAGWR
jgi:hypothetical protein